jgi:glycosyl hydrolase family 43
VAHPFRRLITALAAVASVFAFSAACVAPVPPGTPVAPSNDAIPSNGTPGWFQAGRQWQGDFGDPDIRRVGNIYYAYSAGAGGRYLSVLTSTDLIHWTIHPNWNPLPPEIVNDRESAGDKANNNDALVRPAAWGMNTPVNVWLDKTYWASSVMQIGSTWYAYSAVKVSNGGDPLDPHGYGRFCLTVASAPSPLGPFRDITGSAPLQCQPVSTDPSGSIDPYPYHDPTTGGNYLLWKAAGKVGGAESSILAMPLGSNGLLLHGHTPVKLLQTNRAAPWEGSTIENPSMVTFKGVTYLFYSANDSLWQDIYGRSNYATGYAVCPHGPLAACTRLNGGKTPLLATSGASQGPGGASPVVNATGDKLYVAYASYWLGENRGGYHPRRLHIANLVQNADHTLRVG